MKSILFAVVLTASAAVGQTLEADRVPLKECMERALVMASNAPKNLGMQKFEVYYSTGATGGCYVRLDEYSPGVSRTRILDATGPEPALVATYFAGLRDRNLDKCQVLDDQRALGGVAVLRQCNARFRDEFEGLVQTKLGLPVGERLCP